MIRKGIQYKDFFDYDGTPIPLRPLTSMELDEARYHGLYLIDPKLARLIVNVKLRKYDITTEFKDISPEMFINIDKFDAEIEYWVVFYAMRDFRDDSFKIEDVRSMRYVHDMADMVLSMSSAPTDTLLDFIRTPDGRELGKIIYILNVPLVDEVWKLTDLQHDFLIWSHPNAPKKIANSVDELDKILPALGSMIKRVQPK